MAGRASGAQPTGRSALALWRVRATPDFSSPRRLAHSKTCRWCGRFLGSGRVKIYRWSGVSRFPMNVVLGDLSPNPISLREVRADSRRRLRFRGSKRDCFFREFSPRPAFPAAGARENPEADWWFWPLSHLLLSRCTNR